MATTAKKTLKKTGKSATGIKKGTSSKKSVAKKTAAKKGTKKTFRKIVTKKAGVKKVSRKIVAKKVARPIKKAAPVKKVAAKKAVAKKKISTPKASAKKRTATAAKQKALAKPVKKVAIKKISAIKKTSVTLMKPKKPVTKKTVSVPFAPNAEIVEPIHITANAVPMDGMNLIHEHENRAFFQKPLSPKDIATIGINNAQQIRENISLKHADSHKHTNQKIAGKKPLW